MRHLDRFPAELPLEGLRTLSRRASSRAAASGRGSTRSATRTIPSCRASSSWIAGSTGRRRRSSGA